jgi:hypothetical protein
MQILRIALGNASLLMVFATVVGCGNGNSVTSDEQARRAYLGLDKSVSKSLALGFVGYNAATNANIPTEMAAGDATGSLTISGHVDQGNPSQISMGLSQAMTMYADGKIVVDDKGNTITVTYATNMATPPSLTLKLNSSAGDTLTGSLDGDYVMSGDLQGTVTLSLQINGTFSGTAPNVMRVAGSTTVTGTAVSSSGGMYMVNTTI